MVLELVWSPVSMLCSSLKWKDVRVAAMFSPVAIVGALVVALILMVLCIFAFVFIIPIMWILIVMYIIVPDFFSRFKQCLEGKKLSWSRALGKNFGILRHAREQGDFLGGFGWLEAISTVHVGKIGYFCRYLFSFENAVFTLPLHFVQRTNTGMVENCAFISQLQVGEL